MEINMRDRYFDAASIRISSPPPQKKNALQCITEILKKKAFTYRSGHLL